MFIRNDVLAGKARSNLPKLHGNLRQVCEEFSGIFAEALWQSHNTLLIIKTPFQL